MTDKPDRITSREQEITEELEQFDVQTEEDLTEIASETEAISSPIRENLTDRDTGLGRTLHQLEELSDPDLSPTGGDLDSDQYQAMVAGEEAVGGTTPTPDQNVVEDLAVSAGIEIGDREILHTSEMLEQRDSHRWELDPESSEDYRD